jgi:23S rRNA G2445 N2-methylase RlmL
VIVNELRIVGSTQTNVVMAAELIRVAQRAVGKRPPNPRREGLGQLVYPFDPELAWAAVTYMRTPTRVVWDLFRSTAPRLEPLYDELRADLAADPRVLWRDGDGISVEVRNVDGFAAGARQIVGTVKNAIIDGAAARGAKLYVDPERADLRWVARLDDKGALVISIDLGGGSLSQRGWRREAGPAPIREHLAAVLLMLARFDPRADVLVDPMCGAGTIPIEAVLAARGMPRTAHALAALNIARPTKLGAAGPPPPLFPGGAPLVIGCDVELDVLAAARDNAKSAGVTGTITWQRSAVDQLTPAMVDAIAAEHDRPAPTTGLILCNPPYGERLADQDLRVLYGELAATCARFGGWRAGFIVGNPELEIAFGERFGDPAVKKPLANANLRAYFYLYEL